jgi:hypothetical protein
MANRTAEGYKLGATLQKIRARRNAAARVSRIQRKLRALARRQQLTLEMTDAEVQETADQMVANLRDRGAW